MEADGIVERVSDPADAAASPPVDRRSWPVRVYRLGAEPSDDLSATPPEERLAMVETLSLEAFPLSGRSLPAYRREESPVRLRRRGE